MDKYLLPTFKQNDFPPHTCLNEIIFPEQCLVLNRAEQPVLYNIPIMLFLINDMTSNARLWLDKSKYGANVHWRRVNNLFFY